jgi:serpin B
MSALGTGLRGRVAAISVVVVVFAGACTGAVASASAPLPTGASPSPTAWFTPSPFGSPTGTPSQESARPSIGARPTTNNGYFDLVSGNAAPLEPAADAGAGAASRIDDFGFDLLRRLSASGNLCASPTSIALALAMVRPGARGQTATEMDKVLYGLGADGQAAEIAALLETLGSKTLYTDADGIPLMPSDSPDPANPEPAVELDIANQAFLQKGMTFEPTYLDQLSTSFAAGIGLLDFRADPDAARAAINKWAADKTKGRIPQILQPGDVNVLTRFALADAIYFKANWKNAFEEGSTQLKPFMTAAGARTSVPTMTLDSYMSYTAGSGFKAVELPFGDYDTNMTMTIVVPDDMASFVAGMTSAKLAALVKSEATFDVELYLPRFSADTRVELSATLAAMGMPTLFSDSADLSGITTDEVLKIDKVVHEANIDVVEQGTTASAVTVVTGRAVTGGGETPTPPPHVVLSVDKPFLYLIRDNISGAVLFLGRIDDPSK